MQLLFMSVLIFQVSVIPDTLDIKVLSRAVNIVVLCILGLLMFLNIKKKLPKSVVFLYIFPVSLIILGYSINFLMALDVNSFGQASKLLPWIAIISIPYFVAANIALYWKLFYRFVLFFVTISLVEYFAIFNGFLTPTRIELGRGTFFKGFFSLLHYLEGGIPYYRFYGVFAEPGTAAMFILPALVYAFVFSKKIASVILLVGLFLTYSLGGNFSFLVILSLFLYWRSNDNSGSIKFKILLSLIIISACIFFADVFLKQYDKKQLSASVREENVTNFISSIGGAFIEKPFGFVLEGKSLSTLNAQKYYFGSNFSFAVAFIQGGVLAFFGYSMFFFINVFFTARYYFQKYNPDKITACVFISLPGMLIYCFQRTTILESVVFSFLFAAPLIKTICGRDINTHIVLKKLS